MSTQKIQLLDLLGIKSKQSDAIRVDFSTGIEYDFEKLEGIAIREANHQCDALKWQSDKGSTIYFLCDGVYTLPDEAVVIGYTGSHYSATIANEDDEIKETTATLKEWLEKKSLSTLLAHMRLDTRL